jgi:DNA-directed RNA polymerase sigma subunit (sigma70/sigma32)
MEDNYRLLLKLAIRRKNKADQKADTARQTVINLMRDAHLKGGATLAELGGMLGVSRQRVHQMLREEK